MQNRILLFFVVLTILITSCATQNESVVARYGDYSIPIGEFENAYAQGVGGAEAAKTDSFSNYKNFLDLYVNFKMKLRDAEVRGLDKDPELIKEYEDYKKNVGESYLIEKEIINPGITRLYELRKNEVRASHIMLSSKNKNEEDVYKKTKEIINELNNGASFDSLANIYSEDTFTKASGGDVFFVVAGSILPDLEDAIYSLKVGEVYSEPIKTKFGYHIIKLTDKRKFRPTITASHILASIRDTNNVVDTLKSLEKIKEVKAKLDSGEDFEKLATEYSDDKGSAQKGGMLGPFARRVMVRPFDEAAFNLKVGETSGIVKSDFGYHIIQLLSEQEYPAFNEEKENLLKMYKQVRYQLDLAKYVDSLKKQFGYELNIGLVDYIDSINDTVNFGSAYFKTDLEKSVGDSIIFKFTNHEITFDSLIAFASSDKLVIGKPIKKTTIQNAVDKLTQKELINQKVSLLEKEDADFAKVMDDYRNGLYIFKIQEEEVWNKIDLDSIRVYEYYEQNKNNYVWPDRVDYSEIFIRDSTKSFSLINVLQSGGDFETIAGNENEKPLLKNKKGKVGIVEADKDELSKKAFALVNEGDISQPIKNNGGWSIIKLNEKIPSQIKSYEECKAEVMSTFQELESKRLEQEYLTRLNNIYNPEKNYDELKNVYSSAKNINN